MDKASQLVVKAGNVARHIREIAPEVTDIEHQMISELLETLMKFPIVRYENTTGQTAPRD